MPNINIKQELLCYNVFSGGSVVPSNLFSEVRFSSFINKWSSDLLIDVNRKCNNIVYRLSEIGPT